MLTMPGFATIPISGDNVAAKANVFPRYMYMEPLL